MKTAYVTGATGCIGRNLVNELAKDGWHTVVLHRASSDLTRLKGCDVEFREIDLHDAGAVVKGLRSAADAIFHVAGNTSHWSADKDDQWKDNVLVTRNLVQAALENNISRFVFTSTGATLPHQGADALLAETIPNNYIRTKRLSEIEIDRGAALGLHTVVLHPIIVIGPFDYNSYSQFFTGIKSGKVKIALPGRIAFCHASDVARAHIQAFEKGRCREGYVLGGTYTTWLDLFQRIAKVMGVPPPNKCVSPLTLNVVAHVMGAMSSITKKKPDLTPDLVRLIGDAPDVSFSAQRQAFEVLGYQSRPLDAMINDCYDWLVAEKRI